MSLPKDPFILLSVVNTRLRDEYPSLEALCREEDENESVLRETLRAAGFEYDAEQNRFR